MCDVAYLAKLPDGSKLIINVEDESSRVKQEELEKSYGYKTILVYQHWTPVLTVITTTVPLDRCLKEFHYSETDLLSPRIESLPYDEAWDDLNKMIDKVKDKKVFTKRDCLSFITLPRCCKHDQEKAVEKICEVLLDINVEEHFTIIELAYCMECMIHKYAKSDGDIKRLEKVIGLEELKLEKRTIFDEVRHEERIALLKSLDSERLYSVEELAEKFGFTPDEIKSGK